jgi:hypothetical protein
MTETAVYAAHPSFLAQPSTGRVVHAVELYDNKIFIGHGDYSGNTGPIDVAYWDIQTQAHGVAWAAAPTEEISRFRQIDGALFVPWIDSTIPMPYLGYSTNHGGSWHNVDDGTMGALHIFDVASYSGDPDVDIRMCGARIINNEGHAVVLKSVNGGVTWTIDYDSPLTGGFARFYALHKFGTFLYAIGTESKKFDGNAWSDIVGTFHVGTTKSFVTQGLLISSSGWFDGSNSEQHDNPENPAEKIGGLQHVTMDELGRIWAISSNILWFGTVDSFGISWTRKGYLPYPVFQAAKIVPVAATATLYVVGGDSRVHVTNLPAHP